MDTFSQQRNQLVKTYIAPYIHNKRIVGVFRTVPRHIFVPANQLHNAYIDDALPIGHGQTTSQPSLVAMMTEALELQKESNVLEIGTGSGYQAAILSQLVKYVITIERIPELAEQARNRLSSLGYKNVKVICGDGKCGYLESEPYDAILVTAGAVEIPQALVHQLKVGGRIVIPLGDTIFKQSIIIGQKASGTMSWQKGQEVIFVPLV